RLVFETVSVEICGCAVSLDTHGLLDSIDTLPLQRNPGRVPRSGQDSWVFDMSLIFQCVRIRTAPPCRDLHLLGGRPHAGAARAWFVFTACKPTFSIERHYVNDERVAFPMCRGIAHEIRDQEISSQPPLAVSRNDPVGRKRLRKDISQPRRLS